MKRWFLVPPALLVLGLGWVAAAVVYFERATGRKFYGLAGYHSSWPKDVFHPAAGGNAIVKWSLDVPVAVTGALLFASGVVMSVRERDRGVRPIVVWWVIAIGAVIVFAAAISWVVFNLTGVFI